MTVSHSCIVLTVFVTVVNAADRGSSCVTPNQETATCTPFNECKVIKDAILTRNQSAIDFAKNSQCGYDTEPLVCCGSTAVVTQTTPVLPLDIFTKEPATELSKEKKKVEFSGVYINTLPGRTICGLERETPRLIGAQVTAIDEFPWMALLRYKDQFGTDKGFKCGGTIINNKYVLTAAHCILTGQEMLTISGARLGEWRISTEIDCIQNLAIEDCADPVVDVDISETIPHPYYSARNGNNDVGLVRLEKIVNFTDFIRPICLPPMDLPMPPVGTIMTVCGWGAIENGSQSDVKLKVDLPLVSNAVCAQRVSSSTRISPNQICAGGEEGKDACQGDSGGPLMRTYVDDDSQWYQEGVVSRGRGCGKKNYPGVYTRVARYVGWIINTMDEEN
ncbi:hypothetical protein ILUMI_10306 [Ignelater luminosus]|uniref:CLIP domain-containing serine protease n=1 Tax=Ignelater luminosus TaxID=2038154 RepID=A0A8K0D2C1_IGNLU|nr:hypothetical protein ILUMI_10306 [Ignelater luminosus]